MVTGEKTWISSSALDNVDHHQLDASWRRVAAEPGKAGLLRARVPAAGYPCRKIPKRREFDGETNACEQVCA
ncbi:hypothetical protein [Cupriavidus basilensis]|uniref:Uncharacterized protein n=1 Tax=Cupriavidus basilensis TaxID=68895 RepID=A0A0C4Y3Q2_9BURK|nr:hypothetical protein [Cupriavidus basilensis]AJG17433.1 hypothetical protein RR42_m0018 [Cupriavidus basilensis]